MLAHVRSEAVRNAPFVLTFVALATHGARVQGADVLPELPVGSFTVRLELVVADLFEPLAPLNNTGASGSSFPTAMTYLPDGSGRALIITLGGTIYLLDAAENLSEFHDLVDPLVTEIRPRNFGFTSIAAAPDFATSGRFYTLEPEIENTATPDFGSGSDHQEVLYEYTMTDPSAATLAASGHTRRELIRFSRNSFDHNVNDLAFMPDGTLLIAIGDGANTGAPGDSSNQVAAGGTASHLGKIFRIDPLGNDSANGAYGIPADNPFVGVGGAVPEIYSYGHRNPYRVTIDRQTGDVWVGEVGQRSVEEINLILPGANYGWASKEGSFLYGLSAGDVNGSGTVTQDDVAPDPDLDSNGTGDLADAMGFEDPIFEYDHGTGRSVTGGFVYRGARIPALVGLYIFGDFYSNVLGNLYYGDPASGPVAGQTGDIARFLIDPAGEPMPTGVLSFAEDPDGELLVLTSSGDIVRIVPVTCAADIDGDDDLDLDDLDAFVVAFFAADPAADVTGDGEINLDDLDAFIAAFLAGCD